MRCARLAIAALAFASYASHAGQTLEQTVGDGFAACVAQPAASKRECAGVVIKTADGYRLSPVVMGDHDTFRLAVKLAPGESLGALFHTHLGSDNAVTLISEADVAQADALALPSYVLVRSSGQVRVYLPGMHTYRQSAFATGKVSNGQRVTALDIAALVSAS